jgi:hypothetical protein
MSAIIVNTIPCSFNLEPRSVKSLKLPKLSGFYTMIPAYSLAFFQSKSSIFPIAN